MKIKEKNINKKQNDIHGNLVKMLEILGGHSSIKYLDSCQMTRLYMIVKEMKEIYYNFLLCVILRQEMKWHREVSFPHRLYCQ